MEQKELFERVLKVLAHAAVQEEKKNGKHASEFEEIYFKFRDYVYDLK